MFISDLSLLKKLLFFNKLYQKYFIFLGIFIYLSNNIILYSSFSVLDINNLEPRKEKTDSSNGNNNNALSPQEQQASMHMMMMSSGGGNMDMQGGQMLKLERPNSLGPKITKRINFYHGDNCKYYDITSYIV